MRVRELALPAATSEIDEARLREVHQAFGELGDPPKFVLRRMLTVGGLTLSEMAADLEKQRFVSDAVSVERLLKALKDRHLVEGDFEGRWRVKPELRDVLRQCFEPASLSTRMLQLSEELLAWVAGQNGLIDPTEFSRRFRTKLDLLREKAERDYAEGDSLLTAMPSSAGGVRNIARALAEVAK